MKEKDRKRFQSSSQWFNQFFDGLSQIYHLVESQIPAELLSEGFSIGAENFYFPSLKTTPAIPPYYALLLPGRQAAIQLLSIIDPELISHGRMFSSEPSMVVLAHSMPEKYAWVDEFALKVLKVQEVEQVHKDGDVVWGKLAGRYPSGFFAFQVQYDCFSEVPNPPAAVDRWIVSPLTACLSKGFEQQREADQVAQ